MRLLSFKSLSALHRERSARRHARLVAFSGTLQDVRPPPVDALHEAKIASRPDTFALCRIIGNDLEPRHRAGQSLDNLRFILDHEPQFEGVTKLWLLNRIFNPETESKILALLAERGQIFRRIPFDPDVYQSIGFDFSTFSEVSGFEQGTLGGEMSSLRSIRPVLQAYRARNNYVMNNNGARNEALSFCLEHGKWALPFDGNCFLTADAWRKIKSDILDLPQKRYFLVPMARMQDNADLLRSGLTFAAEEEPQIVFRCDAPVRFSEDHPYGRRPKVELFLHLGVDGPWRRWPQEDFDTPPRKVSPEGYRVGTAGWVARLASGRGHLETADSRAQINRELARSVAIRATLDMLEARLVTDRLARDMPLVYRTGATGHGSDADREDLRRFAQDVLTRLSHRETEKSGKAASENIRETASSAFGILPDVIFPDGFIMDVIALALAGTLPDTDPSFRQTASALLRGWLTGASEALVDNGQEAPLRTGPRDNKPDRGWLSGVWLLLDAVRLVDDPGITKAMTGWCTLVLDQVVKAEREDKPREGVAHRGDGQDLAVAALAAFLSRADVLQQINLRAQARALATTTAEGDQPLLLNSERFLEAYADSLRDRMTLFDVLTASGLRPWESDAGKRVCVALRRTLTLSAVEGPAIETTGFDPDRLLPLNETLKNRTGEYVLARPSSAGRSAFSPGDRIAPFLSFTRLGTDD